MYLEKTQYEKSISRRWGLLYDFSSQLQNANIKKGAFTMELPWTLWPTWFL
jgi:hypothetical protein